VAVDLTESHASPKLTIGCEQSCNSLARAPGYSSSLRRLMPNAASCCLISFKLV
jgi:hypothetical protein